MPSSKVQIISVIATAAIIFLLIALTAGMITNYEWRRRVPKATTLRAFSRSSIPLVELIYVGKDKDSFFLWISDYRKSDIVPSGPSVYVFDGFGRLIDWGFEVGSGQSVDFYYAQYGDGNAISVDSALVLVTEISDTVHDQ